METEKRLKTKEKKKTMLIVWRWNMLEDHVNAKVLQHQYGHLLTDIPSLIAAGKGQFWRSFPVQHSLFCPQAEVIAINLYQDGEKTHLLMDHLLDHFLPAANEAEEHQVMLFLHRGNHYSERDISQYLDSYKNRLYKAFLFATGRDYIYHEVRGDGLLAHTGKFGNGEHKTGERYRVLGRTEEGKPMIVQPFFDRTWLYYDLEFESKVFRLQEDLFDTLFPIFLPGQPEQILKSTLVTKLKEKDHGLLWYRLKSFMGRYDDIPVKSSEDFDLRDETDRELEALKTAERQQGLSFFFDDCTANLARDKAAGLHYVADEFKEVQLLLRWCFGIYEGDPVVTPDILPKQFRQGISDTKVSLVELRYLAERLSYLVKIIPGVMD